MASTVRDLIRAYRNRLEYLSIRIKQEEAGDTPDNSLLNYLRGMYDELHDVARELEEI